MSRKTAISAPVNEAELWWSRNGKFWESAGQRLENLLRSFEVNGFALTGAIFVGRIN